MTLWQLFTALCFVMSIAFAIEAAKVQKPTTMGYLVAFFAGLLIAICTSFLFWIAGGWMQRLTPNHKSLPKILTISFVILLCLIWIGISGWCGEKLAIAGLSRIM